MDSGLVIGIVVFLIVAVVGVLAFGYRSLGWFRSKWEDEECEVDAADPTKSNCDKGLDCSTDPTDITGLKTICTKVPNTAACPTCNDASAETCTDEFCNCPEGTGIAPSAETCAEFCPATACNAASAESCANGNFCPAPEACNAANAETCQQFFPVGSGTVTFSPNKITLTERKYGCAPQTFTKTDNDPKGLPSWLGTSSVEGKVLKLQNNGLFSCYPSLDAPGHYNNKMSPASPFLKYEM